MPGYVVKNGEILICTKIDLRIKNTCQLLLSNIYHVGLDLSTHGRTDASNESISTLSTAAQEPEGNI